MADPVVVPLAAGQRAMLNDLAQSIAVLQDRQRYVVSAIVAGHVDPQSINGWPYSITDDGLVIVPPTPLSLVESA